MQQKRTPKMRSETGMESCCLLVGSQLYTLLSLQNTVAKWRRKKRKPPVLVVCHNATELIIQCRFFHPDRVPYSVVSYLCLADIAKAEMWQQYTQMSAKFDFMLRHSAIHAKYSLKEESMSRQQHTKFFSFSCALFITIVVILFFSSRKALFF